MSVHVLGVIAVPRRVNRDMLAAWTMENTE